MDESEQEYFEDEIVCGAAFRVAGVWEDHKFFISHLKRKLESCTQLTPFTLKAFRQKLFRFSIS